MNWRKKKKVPLFVLAITLVLCFIVNICLGSISIPFTETIKTLFLQESTNSSWSYIILEFRLPKAIVAILVGMGLSTSGMLMQTLFRNPLAGPYVLGLSSGSSLGVGLLIMGASLLPDELFNSIASDYTILVVSFLGSLGVLLLVFLVSQKLKDTMSILVVGLMFSSFTSAIVSALTAFSSAEQLQKFTFWTLGNLGNLSWEKIVIFSVTIIAGLILSLFCVKTLDALLLGENYAKSIGINIKQKRNLIVIATSILAGSITAFVGPIAFIGLAIPHITRLVFNTSQHKILFVGNLFIGAIVMLICDTISQMPGQEFSLPINTITSILGAPVVIWLLMRRG